MSDRVRMMMVVFIFAAWPALVYLLALAGEPQSKWIVCDLLQACQ